MGWMIADEQPPLPAAGSHLTNVGVRIRGDVAAAPHDAPEVIIEVLSAPPHEAE